jgi:hypothetical protein
VVDGIARPVPSLHLARTYRSAYSDFNFQNLPVRNPEYAKTIRQLFLPDGDDYHIVEIDYSGIEVYLAYVYNQDPVLREYLLNPEKDMHRDMAMQCYMLSKSDWAALDPKVQKLLRYFGKNKFVFPQFYGSFYVDCARALWEALVEGGHDDIIAHLRKKGIKKRGECDPEAQPIRGTFEYHIRQVEEDFWGSRFKVYDRWKRKWYDEYQRTGRFCTYTGFSFEGVLKRNDVVNYPIQGSAFHCLLRSMVWLHDWLKKKAMRSRILGQIHDSIVGSVHNSELQNYITKAVDLMTKRVPKEWDWINIPLKVEVDVAPAGQSWAEKQAWVMIDGMWQPKPKVRV